MLCSVVFCNAINNNAFCECSIVDTFSIFTYVLLSICNIIKNVKIALVIIKLFVVGFLGSTVLWPYIQSVIDMDCLLVLLCRPVCTVLYMILNTDNKTNVKF